MTRRQVHGLGAMVFVLAWLAYGIVLGGDYVFDDVHSVAANPALHDLGNLGRLLVDPTAFSATGQSMYRPALLVSFALNMAVSPAAWSLKAGNVLLHALTAWLLWRWLRSWRVRVPAAFASAAVFAVHPLLSECVNLVSARSELLLAGGALLTLLAHRAWQRGRRSALAMAGMVFGTVVACGSKETGVVLPVLLAVQVFAARRPGESIDWRRALAGVLPVVLLVLGYLVLRQVLLGQATVDLLARSAGDPTTGHGRTLPVQLATMGTLLPQALLQMVVPVGMTLDPPVVFRTSWLDVSVLFGWTSLIGLSIAAAWRGPAAGPRRLGLAFAWCMALPWIVVPLNMPLAEHRLYGPMLGLALVVAPRLPRLRGARAMVAGVAVLLAGIAGSVHRSLDYRDEITLWQAELAAQPTSFGAFWGLGAAYLRAGDPQSALAPLAMAHVLRPQHDTALRYFAEALVSVPDEVAQPERALAVTAMLSSRQPDDPWGRTLAAQAHLQAGRVSGARSHFEAAERLALSCLQIAEPKGYVYQLAASARRGLGDLEGALVHLDASVARGLHHTGVRLDRAAVLRDLGRLAEARRELHAAQREAPMDPSVLHALQELAQPPR
jgi:tetratricopeptide (TPR) repeat protein